MVKIIIENNPDLERASLSQQLAQHIERTTPLKRLDTFYRENGLELASQGNDLIDPDKSGFEKGFGIKDLIFGVPVILFGHGSVVREEKAYITKACRTFCGGGDIGFGVELLGDEYAGMVRESLEKFCEVKGIETAKLVRHSQPKGREYPGRITGIAG